MKKILLLLLFTSSFFAQKISPYLPGKEVPTGYQEYLTQTTYYDFNYVSVNHQNFLNDRFGMVLDENKSTEEIENGKGTIINAFTDKLALEQQPKSLQFAYDIFMFNNEFVIENLKVTGSNERVTQFYLYFWDTQLNFDNVNDQELVSNRHLQDRISYSYNSGKPYIIVKNKHFETPKSFKSFFENKASIHKATKNKVSIATQQPEAKTTKTSIKYKVVKKNKTIIIDKVKQWMPTNKEFSEYKLKENITDYLANEKKGKYLIQVTYTTINDELTNVNFNTLDYVTLGLFGK